MTNNTVAGKLKVWLTDGPIERAAVPLCCDLTADGERLLVVDAASCLDPSRLSRAEASVAKNIEVLRIPAGSEIQAVAASLQAARQRMPGRRVMLAGILDHLCGRQVLTKDTARALGRIKQFLGALTGSGLEVTVLCQAATGLGTRTYLISSLCAAADEIRRPESNPQQDVDSSAAAIA
jgi:hypothetical protein